MSFIHSFAKNVDKYEPVKIEAKLNKGLPRLSLVGMSEGQSKRLLLKVKSAIVNQGFDWSLTQHLVVSLEPPVHNSGGDLVELGVALAILQELNLLKIKSEKRLLALGTLDLEGNLEEFNPEEKGLSPKEGDLWIGCFGAENQEAAFFINIKKLSYLNNLKIRPEKSLEKKECFKNYSKSVENLSPAFVELCEVLIHGEHSCLFLMPDSPEVRDLLFLIRESLNSLDKDLSEGVRCVDGERPFVQINSAVSRGQILGNSGKGFYHYAHGGLAYMDHFCNVNQSVRDAIRSKIQGGGMIIGERSNTILMARNPLCPCGKAKLGKPRKCGFSLYKCRSVLEKLSLDEFSLFDIAVAPAQSFFELYPHPEVDVSVLKKRKRTAFDLQKKRNQILPNAQLGLSELKEMMSSSAKMLSYIPVVNGLDRTKAVLSVSRTLADLEGSLEMEKEHIEKAILLAYRAAKEISKAF